MGLLQDKIKSLNIINQKDAREFLGIGKTEFWKLTKLPDFPKPAGKDQNGITNLYIKQELKDWAFNLPNAEHAISPKKGKKQKSLIELRIIAIEERLKNIDIILDSIFN